MANYVKLPEKKLAEWRRRGCDDPWFFCKFLWGDLDLDPALHGPLIGRLFSPSEWLRFMICGFRGSLKSSIMRAWVAWMGLYRVDFSSLWISQRDENALAMMTKVQAKFIWGPTSQILRAVYADRLPGDFAEWSYKQTVLNREDANALPFMTHAGLTSHLESTHNQALVADDLEGADADKSDAPNEDSQEFILHRAQPLLHFPSENWILLGGTPHGPDPLVHVVKELADKQAREDPENPLNWKYWWQPVLDDDAKSVWPKRMTPAYLKTLVSAAQINPAARRLWDKQYMLRRTSSAEGEFDMDQIRDLFYEVKGGRLIRYKAIDYKLDRASGEIESTEEYRYIDMASCRFYLHCDAQHVDPADRRRPTRNDYSEWALIVCAVAPDFHVFGIESFIGDTTFDDYVERFMRAYRRYVPFNWTWESIGAQGWFKNHLRILEQTRYSHLTSLPTAWRPGPPQQIPRPTSRVIEIVSKPSKETGILGALQPAFMEGWLHLHPSQEKLLHQLDVFPREGEPFDGADALSQGPEVWKPPISPLAQRELRRRAQMRDLLAGRVSPTGYVRPWQEGVA